MEVVDPDGGVTKFEYDANGNKTFKEYPNYETVYYSYDACDRVIEMDEYNLGGKKLYKTTYSWDAEGDLLTEMQYNHSQSSGAAAGSVSAAVPAETLDTTVDVPEVDTGVTEGTDTSESGGNNSNNSSSGNPEGFEWDNGNGEVPPGQNVDENGNIVNNGGNTPPGLNRREKEDKEENPNKLLNNDHGNYVYATYTGHIFDTTLDIYFCEARFYDASTRTWLAMDPIKDGGNWYQYCYSSPIVYMDPDGEFAISTALLLTIAKETAPIWGGALIGGAYTGGKALYAELTDDEEGVDWSYVGKNTGRGALDGAIIGGSLKLDPAGAIFGMGSQFVADVLSKNLSTFEAYAGAAVGGAIGSKVLTSLKNYVGANAIGSATGTFFGEVLENLIGGGAKSIMDIIPDTLASGVSGGVAGLLSSTIMKNFSEKVLGPFKVSDLLTSIFSGAGVGTYLNTSDYFTNYVK